MNHIIINSNLTSKINLINCKIDGIEVKIDNIEVKIDNIEVKIANMNDDVVKINEKLDMLIEIINKDVKENCEKMSSHIDFIQKVYDNVKSPMYFICEKFNNIKSLRNY